MYPRLLMIASFPCIHFIRSSHNSLPPLAPHFLFDTIFWASLSSDTIFARLGHESQGRAWGSVSPTLPLFHQIASPKTLLVKNDHQADSGCYKEKYSNHMIVNLHFEDLLLLWKQDNLNKFIWGVVSRTPRCHRNTDLKFTQCPLLTCDWKEVIQFLWIPFP